MREEHDVLIIHGGFHKTGSTAIQQALKDARLKGVRYVQAGYRGLARDELQRGFVSAMRRAARTPLAIASSEATFGLMTDMYRKATSRSARLATYLSEVEYRVVVFVRPLHEWIESVYVQLVQQGETPQTQSFVAGFGAIEALGWSRVLQDIETGIGRNRLVVLPHHGSLDATQSLAGWLGVEVERGSSDRANVSIPAAETAVMAMVNPKLDTRQSKYLRKLLQSAALSAVAREPRSLFDPALQERLLRRSEADWEQVSDRWMSAPCQRENAEVAWSRSATGRPLPVLDPCGDDPAFQDAVQTVVSAAVVNAAAKDGKSARGTAARLLHLLRRSLNVGSVA